jgi:hypothetical protein
MLISFFSQEQYQKNYPNPADDLKHFKIYKKNKSKITAHNIRFANGLETFEMGINQFTDIGKKQMSSYMGFRP